MAPSRGSKPAPQAVPVSPGAPESRLRRHAVWIAVTAAYLFVFPYFERINNPNENVRVWMTRAIVAHGTLQLNRVQEEWGQVGDKAIVGTRLYSSKAPGMSFLGVPIYAAQRGLWKIAGAGEPSKRASIWALRVFGVALPLALFYLFFARRAEAVSGSAAARDLLLLGLGLGTMMYPYGLGFSGHATSAALLFTSFLVLSERSASARRLGLAGLLAGLAVFFEYQTLLAAVVLAVHALAVHRRRVWPFVLGAVGPALLLGLYHTALFGRPWEFPYAHLDDPGYQEFHTEGFFGLARPRMRALRESLFAVDYGLFVFSPFLLAGFVAAGAAIVRRSERRGEAAVVLAVTIVMALFLAGMSNWRGGWCAGGPRYIAAVVPFLVWALVLTWRDLWEPRPLARGALAGMVLASVFLCGLSGMTFPHFPLQFDNPVFDLALPLVRDGYAPYGLGWSLGLRGAGAHLPVLLAFGAGLVFVGLSLARRTATSTSLISLAAALAVAAAILTPLARAGRPRFDERQAASFVHEIWEPGEAHGDH